MYIINDEKVYFQANYQPDCLLEGADLQTFQPLDDKTLTAENLADLTKKYVPYGWKNLRYVAKDRKSIWANGMKVPDADVDSFEYFFGGQCDWGQDRNRAYCFYREGKNKIKVLNAVGQLRFPKDTLGGYMRMYAYDDKYVYYFGRRAKGALGGDCKHLIAESVNQEKMTGTEYFDSFSIISNNTVYYYGKPIVGSDGETARGYSINEPNKGALYIIVDKNGIYYKGKPFDKNEWKALYARIPHIIFELQKKLQGEGRL